MRTLTTLRRAAGALLAASGCSAAGASSTAGRACTASAVEVDSTGLLQRAPQSPSVDDKVFLSQRVSIKNGAFEKNGREVVLMGANSVLKDNADLLDVQVAEKSAKQLAEDLLTSGYSPRPDAEGHARSVIPCVRVGVTMQAVMPNATMAIDHTYVAKVGLLLNALERRGVYAFLDVHSDAWSTTNGGNGFPSWMSVYMQDHAQKGDGKDDSYIATAQHPLKLDLPDEVEHAMRSAGVEEALAFTKQVQNSYRRFLQSHNDKQDRERLFEPYVDFVRELFQLWERHENVVGVELLNAPPPQGLPSLEDARASRQNIWTFYAKVLEDLEVRLPALRSRAPVILQDILGTLEGASPAFDSLFSKPRDDKEEERELKTLHSWAEDGKLGLSFRFDHSLSAHVSLRELTELAHKSTGKWGDVPLFLSEISSPDAQTVGDEMARAVEDGIDAVTYLRLGGTSGDVLADGGGSETPIPSALKSLPASKPARP